MTPRAAHEELHLCIATACPASLGRESLNGDPWLSCRGSNGGPESWMLDLIVDDEDIPSRMRARSRLSDELFETLCGVVRTHIRSSRTPARHSDEETCVAAR